MTTFTRTRPGLYVVEAYGPHEFRAQVVHLTNGQWMARTWTFDLPLDAPREYRTLAEAQQAIRQAAYAIGA